MTENEWQEWQSHPVTEAFYELLRKSIADTQDEWAAGALGDKENQRAIGGVYVLQQLLTLSYSDYVERMKS